MSQNLDHGHLLDCQQSMGILDVQILRILDQHPTTDGRCIEAYICTIILIQPGIFHGISYRPTDPENRPFLGWKVDFKPLM